MKIQQSDRPTDISNLVIIHHWIFQPRGGEKVLKQFCRLFPDSEILTYFKANSPKSWDLELQKICRRAKPTFAQFIYSIVGRFESAIPALLILMPLIMSISHRRITKGKKCLISDAGFAKAGGVGAKKYVYLHTPMRYIWQEEAHFCSNLNPVLRPVWRLIRGYLRSVDVRAAKSVSSWAANSITTKNRAIRFYGINESQIRVIYPPVEISLKDKPKFEREFYLVVSGMEPYKRDDLAIEAANRLGISLVVVGDGRQRKVLESISGNTVKFVGFVSHQEKLAYYQRAKGLLFCGEEDFGIVPLEAIASGCPVLAYRAGGALETVSEGVNGYFFDQQNLGSVMEGIKQFEKKHWDYFQMQKSIEAFSPETFSGEIQKWLSVKGSDTP